MFIEGSENRVLEILPEIDFLARGRLKRPTAKQTHRHDARRSRAPKGTTPKRPGIDDWPGKMRHDAFLEGKRNVFVGQAQASRRQKFFLEFLQVHKRHISLDDYFYFTVTGTCHD